MPQVIDFYFDFSSPYGYIASQKVEALAARHGRSRAVVVRVGAVPGSAARSGLFMRGPPGPGAGDRCGWRGGG